MAILFALVTMALALLVRPDVFVDVARELVNRPGWGISLLTVLLLVGVWIDRR